MFYQEVCVLDMWLPVVVKASSGNIQIPPQMGWSGTFSRCKKYFCKFPLALRYHLEASFGYVRLPLLAPGPLSLYVETPHL